MTNTILQATQDAILEYLKESPKETIEEIEKIFENLKTTVATAYRYGSGNDQVAAIIQERIVLALKAASVIKEIQIEPIEIEVAP
jgi:hypothetical protein